MSETCSVARAAEFIANRPVARRQLLVGVRGGKFLKTFLATALLALQANLAVGSRYAKRPVDGTVAAKEPADGADTNALLQSAGLVRQWGQDQPNIVVDFSSKKLKEFQLQGHEMAHAVNG